MATLGTVLRNMLSVAVWADERELIVTHLESQRVMLAVGTRYGDSYILGATGSAHRNRGEFAIRAVLARLKFTGRESNRFSFADGDLAVQRLERRFSF